MVQACKDLPHTSPAAEGAVVLSAAIGLAFDVSEVPGMANPPGPGY